MWKKTEQKGTKFPLLIPSYGWLILFMKGDPPNLIQSFFRGHTSWHFCVVEHVQHKPWSEQNCLYYVTNACLHPHMTSSEFMSVYQPLSLNNEASLIVLETYLTPEGSCPSWTHCNRTHTTYLYLSATKYSYLTVYLYRLPVCDTGVMLSAILQTRNQAQHLILAMFSTTQQSMQVYFY